MTNATALAFAGLVLADWSPSRQMNDSLLVRIFDLKSGQAVLTPGYLWKSRHNVPAFPGGGKFDNCLFKLRKDKMNKNDHLLGMAVAFGRSTACSQRSK